jgi:hypothetical protein
LNNLSNIEKTEALIMEYYGKFKNINLFVQRGDYKYENAGRIESENESKSIDFHLQNMLEHHKIPFTR